ncbi:hypothetical protein CVT26_015248 [Gymnopilus dilepis]|uniref:Uncharacterized protein n=1 Tax=Gymnopilus dilepis TaxID=231916 RepID=A0A409W9X1_9AGAR|nr:hypothetical protein CVT26_015248 [Gymnopilus dilepis]
MSASASLSRNQEDELLKIQTFANNITTYRSYPFPGYLIEVPYPLDDNRKPVSPRNLGVYADTHRFKMPDCFHGKEVKMVVKDGFDHPDSLVYLECAVSEPGETTCAFFINVTRLLQDEENLEYCSYRKRHRPSCFPSRPARSSWHTLSSDEDTSFVISAPAKIAAKTEDPEPNGVKAIAIQVIDNAFNIDTDRGDIDKEVAVFQNLAEEADHAETVSPSDVHADLDDSYSIPSEIGPDKPLIGDGDICSAFIEAIDIELALRERAQSRASSEDPTDSKWM